MAKRRWYRPRLETLETRLLLNGSSESPLAVPAFSSLPSAPATLYLDFNGHSEAQWGSYTDVTTPAYDVDGDSSSFSAAELANIEKIWRYVAEDFAPLNLNVTTVEPPSFDDGVGLRVAIGGNSAWTGGSRGGLSYVNSFTNSSLPNTVYVFAKELSNGDPRYVADAASHESGHAFGLSHQVEWDGDTLVTYYQTGPGDGTAPDMGSSYSASRSLWWYGTTTSATSFQHDLDVIARSANGFGYRADDHASFATAATSLDFSASSFTASGVIEQMNDLDYFGLSTAGGTFTFTVAVAAPYNNLDTRLELRDANNNLLALSNPSGSFDASITVTLAAGNYFLVVASAGVSSNATASNYGFNVGQYSLSGAVAQPASATSITSLPWINTRTNVSFATARNIASNSSGSIAFATDLHNVANVDYYRFKVPAASNGKVTITMDAAGSLMPRLFVYKPSTVLIGKIGGPAGAIVTLTLNVKIGNTYYIGVNGPNHSVYGKGGYRLFVQFGGFATPLNTASNTVTSSSAASASLALAGPLPKKQEYFSDDGQVRSSGTRQWTFAGGIQADEALEDRVQPWLEVRRAAPGKVGTTDLIKSLTREETFSSSETRLNVLELNDAPEQDQTKIVLDGFSPKL